MAGVIKCIYKNFFSLIDIDFVYIFSSQQQTVIPQTYIKKKMMNIYCIYYLSLFLCLDFSIIIQVDITGLVPYS